MNRWQDVLELDVQVAIYAGNGALWDQGIWNTHKWVGVATGDGLQWTSIYDRVTGVSIDRGRSDMMVAAETGTAQIDVINDDGWASGLQSQAGMAPLVPARQVKILARPAGSYAADPWTTLWIGYVDAVSAPWRTATTSNATLRCVDALARLSRIDPLKVSMPREPINTRVNRIFDMAGWTGGRNLTGSSSFMVKPSTADRNLLDEAQITTLGAMQFVYADRTNTLCTKLLYGTTANFFHVTNNPAANNPAGTWCPNLPIDFPGASAEKVYNRINLANAGLANKAYDNASSQAAYGLRPYTRSDLMGEDVGNDNLGPLLLNHYAWQRPGNVTYDIDLPFGVTKGPALGLAGVELQDQIWTDLKIDPIDGPPWTTTGVNKSYVLIGLAHSITDTQWTVSLTCDQITSTEPAALTEPEPEPEQEMAWH